MKNRHAPLSERGLRIMQDAGIIGYRKSIELIREAWAESLMRDSIRKDKAWTIAGGFCPMCAIKITKYFKEKENEKNLFVDSDLVVASDNCQCGI